MNVANATNVRLAGGAEEPDRRYSMRINVQIQARISGSDLRSYTATLTNLSISGCRLEVDQRLAVPSNLIIFIDGIAPLPASAQWSDGQSIGCRFEEALTPTHCNSIIRHIRSQQRPPAA